MEHIKNQTFDEERALYGKTDIFADSCRFEGPADGESAFKECRGVVAERCFFDLRYPFWHTKGLTLSDSTMTPLCRAALWYDENVSVQGCELHGIKALRECTDVRMAHCDVSSTEFGWFCKNVKMKECSVKGEYFMLRSKDLSFEGVSLEGKYSFQYIENATFENCHFQTKDAFWHAKNVTVKNSVIRGEYLGWYCENVTFENCIISGTQPLCYCKGLKLIDCDMHGADLAFEKSEVEATVLTHVISIKNPMRGHIRVPSCDEIIRNAEDAECSVEIKPL